MRNAIILLNVILLSACGGGGTSLGVLDIQESNTNPPVQTSTSFGNIKVIDGYISGANVYVDYNWNLQQDEGEPSAIEEDLVYRFDTTDTNSIANWSEQCFINRPIVAEVPVGAYDEDLGYVNEAYVMYHFPPYYDSDMGSNVNVTPFTTMFTGYVTEAMADVSISVSEGCDSQADEIAVNVLGQVYEVLLALQEEFDIDVFTFYDDYIANGNETLQAVAEKIVSFLKTTFDVEEVLENEYNTNFTVQLDDSFVDTILSGQDFNTITFDIINVSQAEEQTDDFNFYRLHRYENLVATSQGLLLDSNGSEYIITINNLIDNSDVYITERYHSVNKIIDDKFVQLDYENHYDTGESYLVKFGEFTGESTRWEFKSNNGARDFSIHWDVDNTFVLSIASADNTYLSYDAMAIRSTRDLTELENLYNDINTLSNDIELFYQNQYLLYGDDSQTRRRNNFMYQEYGWSGAEKKCINLDTNEVFTDQEAYDVCITNL